MRILPIGYRRLMRSLEQHLANHVEQREDNAIEARLATLTNSATKQRKSGTEPMPFRLRIAVAFASLASALFSLYWWYP